MYISKCCHDAYNQSWFHKGHRCVACENKCQLIDSKEMFKKLRTKVREQRKQLSGLNRAYHAKVLENKLLKTQVKLYEERHLRNITDNNRRVSKEILSAHKVNELAKKKFKNDQINFRNIEEAKKHDEKN